MQVQGSGGQGSSTAVMQWSCDTCCLSQLWTRQLYSCHPVFLWHMLPVPAVNQAAIQLSSSDRVTHAACLSCEPDSSTAVMQWYCVTCCLSQLWTSQLYSCHAVILWHMLPVSAVNQAALQLSSSDLVTHAACLSFEPTGPLIHMPKYSLDFAETLACAKNSDVL